MLNTDPHWKPWGPHQDRLHTEQSVQTAGVLSFPPGQHRSLTAAPSLACALRTVHLVAATEVSPGQTSLEEESI